MLRTLLAFVFALGAFTFLGADAPKPLKILFLGDNGHHKPAERFRQLQPVLAQQASPECECRRDVHAPHRVSDH